MHDDHSHHAHGHLDHLVRMRVVHEGAAVLHLEFVDEGLAGLDMRLAKAAYPVHPARQDKTLPMDGRMLRQFVGDEDADLVALDGLDGRARRLTVVAPEMGLHAFGEFALAGFSNQMDLLPVAGHTPPPPPT